MKRLLTVALFAALIIIIATVVSTVLNAPDVSEITVRGCLTSNDDTCLALPQITGDNLEGEEITLPDNITSDFALIVMPFSREQQEAAQAWLPVFQNIAQEDARLSYYNMAVLVVEPAFRPLVTGGLNLGVRDPEVRQAVIIAFVEETAQQQVITTLNFDNTDEMLVLLVDQAGQVLWQGTGSHSEVTEAALRNAIPSQSE